MTDEDIIEKIGGDLASAVNSYGSGKGMNLLASKMLYIHPTLNQSFTGGFVLFFVREMSNRYKNGNYDGRNETACKMCNAMWEGLKTQFPYLKDDVNVELPFI